MNLTPNRNHRQGKLQAAAVASVSRRAFMKGAAAAVPSLGAAYFATTKSRAIPSASGSSALGTKAPSSSPSTPRFHEHRRHR